MSQQSNSSPSKNMPCSPSAEPSNPNKEDPVDDSVDTPHARRPKETVSGFSSSIVLEERTKEGSRYVHNAIATIVTGILSGNHEVPGVSIPLNTIEPDSVADQENTESLGKNISDDVEKTDAHKESNVDKPLDNVAGEEVHVTHDVSDNPNCEAETVDLEESSDNKLLSSVLPSIAKRVRTRREKKIVAQRSPRKKIDVPTSSKTTVAVESFLKRKVHGPTKSWSKVVPKKKKTKFIVVESDSDVPCNVPDILWKYVYQKRLALERELAQNVLDCKDIMDLIQEAGLMKTVTQFSKCYEMLVKEFIVNLSEECADGKSKEFRKVYVRGKCVNFSPSVINKYLGRPDEAQPELEVTDNKICQVIIANQVRKWPLKGKLVASKLSVKYAMLHKIGAANWVPTNHKSTVAVMLGKELEARKLNLEKLISSLEMTEGDVLADGGEFGEAVAVAEEAERQGEEVEADATPDDGTDDNAYSESDD
ncbi:uncharacterized protein LOC127091097 [Lathyrus oleraceus]|uniref:uncharacterized protein LOC127091097 n=1 Tax=Pisum sativum TaxID=3888 RepID=UPI0021CEE26B|nr:uncharacterized protein LOC127091097 [Pisum sativum]